MIGQHEDGDRADDDVWPTGVLEAPIALIGSSDEDRVPLAAVGTTQRVLHDRRTERYVAVTKAVLISLFGPIAQWRFAVRLWTGEEIVSPGHTSQPAFTLVLEHPSSLRAMLLPPSELALGEAFIMGAFNLEGDLEAAAGVAEGIRARLAGPRTILRLLALLYALPLANVGGRPHRRIIRRPGAKKHSQRRDTTAVRSHYDVGNEFYRLWLDPLMVYSCAYFARTDMTLAEAQLAKLDLICRKLRLRPGERLLDIGCGWGGLIVYAAATYGVDAVGVTLSDEQASVARHRIAQAGLCDHCHVRVMDYREKITGATTFDKIVSVGMVEHVGHRHLSEYFHTVFDLLAPGGLFLNHGIVEAEQYQRGTWNERIQRRLWRQGEFIDRYVFPDGELVPVGTMVTRAEDAGFELRDAEALREHYARTLRCWVDQLRCSWEDALPLVGPETARTWMLYMAASAYAFTSGRLNLVQLLLGKRTVGGDVVIPPTRDDIYSNHSDHRQPLSAAANN